MNSIVLLCSTAQAERSVCFCQAVAPPAADTTNGVWLVVVSTEAALLLSQFLYNTASHHPTSTLCNTAHKTSGGT